MNPDNEQGSPAWHASRVGRVTASRISDVLAKGKGSAPSKTRLSYRDQLVAERLTGDYLPSYQSEAMTRGIEQEPFARAAYEAARGVLVDRTGGRPHPWLMAGASPDGEVGYDGLLEIKCPNTATHIGWLVEGVVPAEHRPQMLWQLACYPERKWCDFVSFDVRLPASSRLLIVRLDRDDEWIANAETEVAKFLAEVDEIVARYTI